MLLISMLHGKMNFLNSSTGEKWWLRVLDPDFLRRVIESLHASCTFDMSERPSRPVQKEDFSLQVQIPTSGMSPVRIGRWQI